MILTGGYLYVTAIYRKELVLDKIFPEIGTIFINLPLF